MRTSVIVQNLKCAGCANTINSKLSSLENISNLEVDVESSKVSFNYQNESDALLVKDKLRALGYPSIENKNSLIDKTKSVFSCASGRL